MDPFTETPSSNMYSFSVLYGKLYDFYSDEFLFGQNCFELLYFRLRRIKIRAFDFMAIRSAELGSKPHFQRFLFYVVKIYSPE